MSLTFEPRDKGPKWTFLEHKGPIFAPAYEKLPENVRFKYNGEDVELSIASEEVAKLYAEWRHRSRKPRKTTYGPKENDWDEQAVFNTNFLTDWRKVMSDDERGLIQTFSACDFSEIEEYIDQMTKITLHRSTEEKKEERKKRAAMDESHKFCNIDGNIKEVQHYKIDPPRLFCGLGFHPKMGCVKTRIIPEDVTLNCSMDSSVPTAPDGHSWKEILHDDKVRWLARWPEPATGTSIYMLPKGDSEKTSIQFSHSDDCAL